MLDEQRAREWDTALDRINLLSPTERQKALTAIAEHARQNHSAAPPTITGAPQRIALAIDNEGTIIGMRIVGGHTLPPALPQNVREHTYVLDEKKEPDA